MSYSEFDINRAINPVVAKKSVKLPGMTEVAKIYKSNSTSTEEFISGAIHNLGIVNRNVMFVNSSISGLRDRLQIAAKVAKNVNMAKDRGIEGFSSVPKMDPWQYALESGIGDFFSKVWEAIKAACRRLITAIANIIKHIQIFISRADVKSQVKDYKYFVTNKKVLEKSNKAALNTKLNAISWKVNGSQFPKIIKDASSKYITAFRGMFGGQSGDGKALDALASIDMSLCKTPAGFRTVSNKIFGYFGDFEREGGKLSNFIEKITKKIDAPRLSVIGDAKLDENASASKVAHALVYSNNGKVSQVTVKSLMDSSKEFSVLSEKWLADNVTSQVTALNDAVKQMTTYTKAVDKAATAFKKAAVDSVNNAGLKSLSSALSQMSNARIRSNSWFTSLMLELELAALRYRKNVHNALKIYIRGAAPKESKKSKENYDINSLFTI